MCKGITKIYFSKEGFTFYTFAHLQYERYKKYNNKFKVWLRNGLKVLTLKLRGSPSYFVITFLKGGYFFQ